MSSTIESVLQESRIFPPSPDAVRGANISGMDAYRALCAEAERDYEGFWARLAREELLWKKPFTRVLDESKPPSSGGSRTESSTPRTTVSTGT